MRRWRACSDSGLENLTLTKEEWLLLRYIQYQPVTEMFNQKARILHFSWDSYSDLLGVVLCLILRRVSSCSRIQLQEKYHTGLHVTKIYINLNYAHVYNCKMILNQLNMSNFLLTLSSIFILEMSNSVFLQCRDGWYDKNMMSRYVDISTIHVTIYRFTTKLPAKEQSWI